MQRLTHQAMAYYRFDSLQALQHGIFTRQGGVSEGQWASLNMSCSTGDAAAPVNENRRRSCDALGLKPEHSVTSWLVHGNTVRVVSHEDMGEDLVHADAMVTRARGLVLTLRFADCVPVLFFDPVKGAAGIAHAGWKGIVNGVLPATVQTMQRAFGSQAKDIVAGVGPSIGPDKFEVSEDVAAQIQATVAAKIVRQHREPAEGLSDHRAKPRVDLWTAAESQLQAAGVGQIEIAGICTASNTTEWFSHRAEHGKTGRFGAVIVL